MKSSIRPVGILLTFLLTLLLTAPAADAQSSDIPRPVKEVTSILRSATRSFKQAQTDPEKVFDAVETLSKLESYCSSKQTLSANARRDLGDAFYNLMITASKLSGESIPSTFKNDLAIEMLTYKTLGDVVTEFWSALGM